jgi:hypothetical protein
MALGPFDSSEETMRGIVAGMLLCSMTALGMTALADEPKAPAPAPTAKEPLAAFEGHKSLSDDELGKERAKAKLEVDRVTINTDNQEGLVSSNTAVGTQTGGNTINGAAFSNASGFISAVQNTGNNVLIQNSTIINVSVQP